MIIKVKFKLLLAKYKAFVIKKKYNISFILCLAHENVSPIWMEYLSVLKTNT